MARVGCTATGPATGSPPPGARDMLGHARDVMSEALAQGGTSFDALYVNVNGESGYFDRSLHAYGRRASRATLRYADPAGRLHEPFVLLLPDLPAPAPPSADAA